jgi:hypothetical protein
MLHTECFYKSNNYAMREILLKGSPWELPFWCPVLLTHVTVGVMLWVVVEENKAELHLFCLWDAEGEDFTW